MTYLVFTYQGPNIQSWNNVDYVPHLGLVPKFRLDGPASILRITSYTAKNSKRKFTRIVFLLQKILQLLKDNEYSTLRDVYYQGVKNFSSQGDVVSALRTISSILQIPRYELHIFASSKGLIYGNLSFLDSTTDELVDCSLSIKSVPEDVLSLRNFESSAEFCLVIEKDASFQSLVKCGLVSVLEGKVILITGKGIPDLNTRHLVRKISETLKIPIFILADGDPYGIDIMFVYKFGSLSMTWCCEPLAVPSIKWLGVHPTDFNKLPQHQLLSLNNRDIAKCHSLLKRPYIDSYHIAQINEMLYLNIKSEIQGVGKNVAGYIVDKIVNQEFI